MEWFASSLINKLVGKLCNYGCSHYQYQLFDAKAKLRQMENNLRNIQVAIHVIEVSQIITPSLAEWLRVFKRGAHELEDVLDKFDYRVLEDKVCNLNNQVCGFFQAPNSLVRAAKRARRTFSRLLFCDEDVNELLGAMKNFERISDDMKTLIKLLDLAPKRDELLDWRKTTSISKSKLFGRDSEREKLVNLIFGSSDASCSSTSNFSVISIVGIGGVGKTTLAQDVYNNSKIKAHFDLRGWVCVSHKFDVKRITVEIIESASMRRHKKLFSVRSLDMIQSILVKGLEGKRILFVLDDVWNEANCKWNILSKPFQFAKEGSIILITTRNQRIADMMGTTDNTVKLEGLGDEEYLPLFMQCAFGHHNPFDHPRLLHIGTQIAYKLGGSPLAAKTIGGVLKSKLEEEHWRTILASNLWQVHQNEGDILPALGLSYEHLPAHLKQCFAYCSIFPKNHCFERDSLIQMWMALGFVQPNGLKRLEDIAGEYIDDLFSRFFFQQALGSPDRFVIHDLVHNLAESVSTGEHFRIENDFSVEIPRGVNHLYVNAANLSTVYESATEMKSLRSLVVSREEQLPRLTFAHVFEEVIKELKSLRVLVLHDLPLFNLTESLGNLMHLRYLEIQSSYEIVLPKSFRKLYHLQGLKLKKTNSLSCQYWPLKPHPKAIRDLINLRYLRTSAQSLTAIPGIGSLTSLQELEQFSVKKMKGFHIGELSKLRQLHGQLCINNLENVDSEMQAREAGLPDKKHVKKLSLCWNYLRQGEISTCKDDEILEGLRPHQDLVELKIRRYMGIEFPSWLSTSNLELIEFSHCDRLQFLPPLGQLPFLKILHLKCLKSIRQVGPEFYGNNAIVFRSLEELRIETIPEWKKWSQIEPHRNLFPCLNKLHINSCHKLKDPFPVSNSQKQIAMLLTDKITPIAGHTKRQCKSQDSTLEIITDRIWSVPQCISIASLGLLQRLEVSSTFLMAFTEDLEEWIQKLTSLRHLSFTECYNMSYLPKTLIWLMSLETIRVNKCPKLKSLPENGFPFGLRELHINGCHRELKERCNWRKGADWHKIFHIETVIIDGETAHKLSSHSEI